MADTSNGLGSGEKKRTALRKISSSFNLGLCQAGRERKTPAEYVQYAKEESERHFYLSCVCTLLSALCPPRLTASTLPVAFAVLAWELETRFETPFWPCKWSLMEQPVLVVCRVAANVLRLICLLGDGEVSEAGAASAHSIATSCDSPAFEDTACLLAESLLPITPLNSFKSFLTMLESSGFELDLKVEFYVALIRTHPESRGPGQSGALSFPSVSQTEFSLPATQYQQAFESCAVKTRALGKEQPGRH